MYLSFDNTNISNLDFIRHSPLSGLGIVNSKVTDLSPLLDTPIVLLRIGIPSEQNMKTIMKLKLTNISISREADIEQLRDHPTLRVINGKTAKEFWPKYDAKMKRGK